MVAPAQVGGSHIELVELLRDTGTNGFALARLRDFGRERVGLRWNGSEGGKGAPTTNGCPHWFMLPDEIAALLVDQYRGPVRDRAA